MKITARVTYAILALFELALHPPETRVQAREIAQRQQIPLRFLEQIMIQLRKARFVRSTRGAAGGYVLDKPPAQITLKDVVEAVEGGISFFDPKLNPNSSILKIWSEIEGEFLEKLRSITLQDLVRRKFQEDKVIVYHI
ncbi:Rrf2 family transcriptional regulator [Acidobacteria bacterium AH-259-O06]|nr:Rrf2 family transcriptional regulator [Acidobacteria bacterium AH-259-O06]